MYKKIEVVPQIKMNNDVEAYPVASLRDEYGGEAHIIIDDHCYVLVLKDHNKHDRFKNTAWIFPEAFEVLKQLPSPSMG